MSKRFFKSVYMSTTTIKETKTVHNEPPNGVAMLPCHELLKLGAGEVETGPVGVCHGLVLRRAKVSKKRRHFVKGPPTDCFVISVKRTRVMFVSHIASNILLYSSPIFHNMWTYMF